MIVTETVKMIEEHKYRLVFWGELINACFCLEHTFRILNEWNIFDIKYWLSQMKGFAQRKPSVSRVACRRLQEKINFLVRVAAGTIM